MCAFFHEEGAFERYTCARARCTPPSCVVHHRITLMELYRCTKNSHIACSKFLEVRGHPMCTCVARAHCTTTPQVMHHRKVLVELYQCTKFRVASSKFPESKGAYACANSTCIARVLCTPSLNGMHHRIMLLNSISVPNLVSIGQNFLKPEDPSRINFSGLVARSLHPTRTATTKTYMLGSMHVTCKFGISRAHRVACRGGKRTTGANHLHVHCTCTMHPSPFLHTAPSRPCQGVPMYRVWCP